MLRDSSAALRLLATTLLPIALVRRAGASALIVLMVAASAGCGIKGPLRLPPPPPAATPPAAPDAGAAKPDATPATPPKPSPPDTPVAPPPAAPPVKP